MGGGGTGGLSNTGPYSLKNHIATNKPAFNVVGPSPAC